MAQEQLKNSLALLSLIGCFINFEKVLSALPESDGSLKEKLEVHIKEMYNTMLDEVEQRVGKEAREELEKAKRILYRDGGAD